MVYSMVYKKTQPVSEMKSTISVKVMMALKYMYVFSLAFLVSAIAMHSLLLYYPYPN